MYFNYFSLLLLGAVLLLLGMAAVTWRSRRKPGVLSFLALLLASSIYTLGYAGELSSLTIATMMPWIRLEYLGTSFLPTFLIIFSLSYTHRSHWLKRPVYIGLFTLPILILLMLYTNDSHHLFYARTWLNTEGLFPVFASEKGPWYWPAQVYSTASVLFSNWLFFLSWRQVGAPYRRMFVILFVGSLTPWLSNIIYLSGKSPWHLDITPLALGGSCLLFLWGLRYHFLELPPVARTLLFEKLSDAVIITDAQGQIVDFNQAAKKHFGLDKNTLGQTLKESLIGWENSDKTWKYTPWSNYHCELTQILAGHFRSCELRMEPIYQSEEHLGYTCIICETTQQYQARRELRESELRYRQLFENNPLPMWITELESQNFLAVNEAAITHYGWQREEFLLLRQDQIKLSTPKPPTKSKKEPQRIELQRHIKKNGEFISVKATHYSLDFGGKSAELVLLQDITEQEEVEKILHYQVELLSLISHISTRLIHLPAEEIDTALSAAMSEIGSLLAVDRSLIFQIKPNDKLYNTHEWQAEGIRSLQASLQGVSAKLFPWGIKQLHRFAVIEIPKVSDLPAEAWQEKELWLNMGILSLLVIPMVWQNTLQGFISFDSVTQERNWSKEELQVLETFANMLAQTLVRKQTEEALLESNAQLEASRIQAQEMAEQAQQANQTKSEFLANISHELRTPMNGIIGMSALLLESNLSTEQKQYASTVNRSGEALLDILNDLLDFSKMGAHKLELEWLDFDLHALLEDTAEMLAVKAQEKDLELICLIAPEVSTWVRGDPARIRQILLNLGGNAVKFTDKGHVLIQVRPLVSLTDSLQLEFRIEDTGIGIPAARQNLLFSPFTQADGSTTRKYGGTGLGLAICKQLIALMNGSIEMQSKESEGSVFIFTIPLDSCLGTKPAVVPPQLKGLRFLLASPHAALRQQFSQWCQEWGAELRTVNDGESAVEMAWLASSQEIPFDLVLLDHALPDGKGTVWGNQFNQNKNRLQTQPLLLTPMTGYSQIDVLKQFGFVGSLTKPLRKSVLEEALVLVVKEGNCWQFFLSSKQDTLTGKRSHHQDRILVAEDNPTNQLVALRMLEKLGYQADAVASGEEVLLALKTIPYTLILMDCQMPNMDGFEATRQIRSRQTTVPNPNIPIVALTADIQKGTREHCLQVGMNDYLSKPLLLKELESVLQKNLNSAKISTIKNVQDKVSTPPKTIFEPEYLLSRVMQDREFAQELVSLFLSEIPSLLGDLELFLVKQDFAETAKQLHRIKGATSNLTQSEIIEIIKEMESAALNKQQNQLESLWPQLELAFSKLKTALEDFALSFHLAA
jgi:two-component system, sensor histidine kinase and response regulator